MLIFNYTSDIMHLEFLRITRMAALKISPAAPVLPSLFLLLGMLFVSGLTGCKKDIEVHQSALFLKTGTIYTAHNAEVSQGGTIRIGVLASGAGAPLTYLRIERITERKVINVNAFGTMVTTVRDTLVQKDKGLYLGDEGLDEDFTFAKDTFAVEEWRVLVMNADKSVATGSLTVKRGTGTDWGAIKHYTDMELSLQDHLAGNWYLDADQGAIYNALTVAGHEAEVDIVGYFYITSGLPSPTLACPGYTSVVGYYSVINGWNTRNTTLYDYASADNNLVSPARFDEAVNDSLLVTAYKPDKVSGNCKYCYTGKVIPFKTAQGKYGMVKVVLAEENAAGTMKLEVKIQE